MTRAASALLLGVLAAAPIAFVDGQPRASATREDAYRHNNVGVARLEQYNYADAVPEFRRALELHPDLALARLNLAIARLYDGQLEPAAQDAKLALERMPDRPQPHFVLGLIARADNRPDDAAAAFQKVLEIDPGDAGAHLHLGQVRLGQRQFPEAVTLFERAIQIEPFNATAAYGLAQALTRSGDRPRSEAAMARFQALRDNPAATTYASTYLEQGRYGEAIASTGLEPELVDREMPAAVFVDATASLPPAQRSAAHAALADIDGDGQVELLVVQQDGVHLLRRDKGRLAAWRVIQMPGAIAALAGDYDNDGSRDVAVLTAASVSLFKQEKGGFRDVTKDALPQAGGGGRTAAFVDADHDGDLDLLAGARLLRNTGAGRFEDVTAEAKLGTLDGMLAVAPTDFDNRRDVDLLIVRTGAAPALFSNQRDATFVDVAAEVGLPRETSYTAVATGDINKDMAPDYFFARADGDGVFAMSGPVGRFSRAAAPAGTNGARAALLLDYDNDGLLDLLAATPAGPRLWRFLGTEWADVSSQALAGLKPAGVDAVAIDAADLDGDGDHDLIARLASGELRLWRNEGGNKRPSLRVQLAARVSNRDAVGAKVELRAGSLRDRVETFATTPAVAPADVLFGLGSRAKADVVRVLWPAGILQAETEVTAPVMRVEELDRKPSSCPFLYTWNGERFEFITDFLGGGELGYWMGPGVRGAPDPDEYVRIPGGQLKARDGGYELRITNELEEALFVDRVQLVVVDHPEGVEVHPNEGLRSPERREPFTLYTARSPRPPLRVLDQNGRDVRDRVAERDRRYVDGFRLAPIQGYAEEHWVAFDIGPDIARSGRATVRQGSPERPARTTAPPAALAGAGKAEPLHALLAHPGDVPVARVPLVTGDGVTPGRTSPASVAPPSVRPATHRPASDASHDATDRGTSDSDVRPAPTVALGDPPTALAASDHDRPGQASRASSSAHASARPAIHRRTGNSAGRQALARGRRETTAQSDDRVLLLLTGWTDYAFSSDNVAAHQADLALRPPELQARDVKGQWRRVVAEIGMPVGRPQTVVLDITPHVRAGAREFRVVTTMRVYWDQILVDASAPADTRVSRIDAASAVLRWRGFSAEVRPDGQEPPSYDYRRVGPASPWKLMPGRYTREGDVAPLLAAVDDQFVIAAPGDEVALSFRADALPSLPDGWTRTFLFYADGFSKEMNLHSSSPDALAPLPFHGMTQYPYTEPERYPDTPAHRRYLAEYNTRVIGRTLPPLETTR